MSAVPNPNLQSAERAYELMLLRLAGGLSAALVATRRTVSEVADDIARHTSADGTKIDANSTSYWLDTLHGLLSGKGPLNRMPIDLRDLATIEDALGFDVWVITATD